MRGELIPAVDADWVTVRQRRFRTFGRQDRAIDLLMASRWWRLEVLRAYAPSAASARYARAMWDRGMDALAREAAGRASRRERP